MKKFLMNKGIPKNNIVCENQAKNTMENAYYAVPLFESLNVKEVTLITSESHMPRASYLMEAVFSKIAKGVTVKTFATDDALNNKIFIHRCKQEAYIIKNYMV